MGIETVAVHSDVDMNAPFVREADQAVFIGLGPAHASYLNMDAILDVAKQTECEAIHPGYGFLSEDPEFSFQCAEAGLIFIGPSPEAIAMMGQKIMAREIMQKVGVPVAPGSSQPVSDPAEAIAIAEQIGYPVLIKPAAGGGGIGMSVADTPDKLKQGLKTAQTRAQRAFGDDSVFLERFIPDARHIEIQVLFDSSGNGIHLYERECSVQRRYQKVIEETPSPALISKPELRQKMAQAALKAASAVGYRNAGTVEFILAQNGEFYFLEMNTRLQVEHPVTEMTLGLDLVEWQIRISAGEPLTLKQEDIKPEGHAIEYRIYAEDPVSYLPQPGQLTLYEAPATGKYLRLDDGFRQGDTISSHYDPLIAKLIVWGQYRDEALIRSKEALNAFKIEGLKTNIPLHQRLLENPAFSSGNYHTGLLKS
jgi:acetyl-CoA carboxylase biotin carboxylase subunit